MRAITHIIPTKPMPVRNLWSLFNLKESPFFQEALQVGTSHRPVEQLFVGRQPEVTRILNTIGSGGGSSRQAISGSPGVGKSSLAQYIKAQVLHDGLLSAPEPVALGHADDIDTVATRILGYVYEAVITAGDARVRKHEVVEDVRQLVRAFRTIGLSGGVSLPMGGFSLGHSLTHVNPPTVRPSAVLGDLLRRLIGVVRQRLRASGVIVHVNNLENLSEADAVNAAHIMRDLRDQALLIDGYHWLLVGTSEAIRTVVFSTDQVRTVVEGPRLLSPLPLDDVLTILSRRYAALREKVHRPIIPPVADDVVRDLFTLFRGDLRGTMAALHTAAQELLSFGEHVTSPLNRADVRAVLHERYREELSARLGNEAERVERLARYVKPDGTFVQKQASQWWDVSQTETSRTMTSLIRSGYVIELAEESKPVRPLQRGRRPVMYALSGAARLVFDPLPTS
jgi:hypothetical protein